MVASPYFRVCLTAILVLGFLSPIVAFSEDKPDESIEDVTDLVPTWQFPRTQPLPRMNHSGVWNGYRVMIWGGEYTHTATHHLPSGKEIWRYIHEINGWECKVSPSAPPARTGHSTVWTGKEMIIWGGMSFQKNQLIRHNDGWRYDPATNQWTPLTKNNEGSPSSRLAHSAVWTGKHMIIWGGLHTDDSGAKKTHSDGAIYDSETDQWSPIPTAGSPSSRDSHSAVWTGTHMIIWGGVHYSYTDENGSPKEVRVYPNEGAMYDPVTQKWEALPNAPMGGREGHVAVWTGKQMVVYGGVTAQEKQKEKEPTELDITHYGPHILVFTPATQSWKAMPISGATHVTARAFVPSIWTGSEIVIWGGKAFEDLSEPVSFFNSNQVFLLTFLPQEE